VVQELVNTNDSLLNLLEQILNSIPENQSVNLGELAEELRNIRSAVNDSNAYLSDISSHTGQ